jgi:hypothetical protein
MHLACMVGVDCERAGELRRERWQEEKKVDIDLALEGCATKVSREQAHIKLRGGHFKLINIGRRAILVNNCLVESGHVRAPPLTRTAIP